MSAVPPRFAIEPVRTRRPTVRSLRTLILSTAVGLAAGSLIAGPTETATAIPTPSSTTSTTASVSKTVGLFSSKVKPTKYSNSRKSVERGVKFSASSDGELVGLQFYRTRKQKRAYVGSLWDSDGTLLATLKFAKSSKSGWQTAKFSTPVTIVADHTYVASYLDSNGRFAVTRGAFTHDYTRNGLTVTAMGGVYKTTKVSKMPKSSYKGSSYMVDVVFRPKTSPKSKTPSPSPTPTASASSPAAGAPSASTTPSTPSDTVTASASASPTETATSVSVASSSLHGWQLTTSNIGLAAVGLKCDSLPRYTGSLKPAAGTRISGVRIEGNLDLSAGDIIVERSCIRPLTGDNRALVSNDICGAVDCLVTSPKSVIIRDSEFDASAIPADQIAASCAFRGVGTLQRNYMHGMGSGICFFGTGFEHSGLAEQNYVTELRAAGASHNEAATVRDLVSTRVSSRTVKFVDNRLNCETGNDTGGLFIQPTWDDIHNVYLTGNYIEGGGYNLFLNKAGGDYYNVHSVNNRFRPTGWGPSTVQGGEGYSEWSDNYEYDASQPDAAGRVVIAG